MNDNHPFVGVRQFIKPVRSRLFIQVAFTALYDVLFAPMVYETDEGMEMVDLEHTMQLIAVYLYQQRNDMILWDRETRMRWYETAKTLHKVKQQQSESLGGLAGMMGMGGR